MPAANPFAYFMLAIWPVVAWVFFTRLDVVRALIWTILGAYMLLPPVIGIDLPMVPDFNKYSIPNLAAGAAVVFLLKDRFSILPASPMGRLLIMVYVASPFVTVLTNGEVIGFEQAQIQAVRLYDSIALVAQQFIALLPFFLARKYLNTDQAMRAVLVALVIAGLIYSLPMLLEARISPQLNIRVYGYFQHDFSQAIRGGGFRPFVFMPHGLWVAFFGMMCLISAVTLFRIGPADQRPKLLLAALYLTVVLIYCRSAGPLIYALLLAPIVLILPRRLQVLIASAMVIVVITYPALRGLHLIPLDFMLDTAGGVDVERRASLAFRFDNEEMLLARAAEKAWFGWGGYGRNLLHDPVTGEINVIADGGWVIVLGTYGWVGYVAQFGLLALPVFLITREALLLKAATVSPFACTLTLLLAANLFDLLPNDTLIPFTWLMAGALQGYAEALRAKRRDTAAADFNARYIRGRTIL
jgi:hypothetical protein